MTPRSAYLIFVGSILFVSTLGHADNPPPLEVYGALPDISLAKLSPSGHRMAARFFTRKGEDLVLVIDLRTNGVVSGANAAKVKPRSLSFVNDNHLLLISSGSSKTGFVGQSYEKNDAEVLDINSSEIRTLFHRTESLYPHQSGLGRTVGSGSDGLTVYMPAFVKNPISSDPNYSLFAIGVEKTRQKIVAGGNSNTIDWFVNQQGVPLVREDYDNKRNIHRIWRVDSRGDEVGLLYEEETDRVSRTTVGLTKDQSSLVFSSRTSDGNSYSLFIMSLNDGEVTGPIMQKDDLSIERVLVDINRVVYGVEYEGFFPRYAFLDESLSSRVQAIQEGLPNTSVSLASWSRDFSSLIFYVSGKKNSGAYLLFENGVSQARKLSDVRPDIAAEEVADISVIKYESRDGLKIPALVTTPVRADGASASPLIVLPHGGPASHDQYGFDWMAQYFASRGYLVIQPQFRGSTGFGNGFLDSGVGEFGGRMRLDVDDGVKYLIESGRADPDRICIAGASYGGYLALAAGAFSPDLYSCIIAISPVSDLRKMLNSVIAKRGQSNWLVDYWESLYGSAASEKEELKDISPALHADSFRSPVLLIHGNKDTVVPMDQSKIMYKALKKEKKDVTFVRLKGEDHWLSTEKTRIETLQAMSEFLKEHL